MTLILSAIVPGFAVQCSDRRLTGVDGSVLDDNANKSVIWCNRWAVGFTGLANITRKPKDTTSKWIAETLWRQTDFQQGVDHLAAEAQNAVDRLPKTWPERRLAMHVSGFLPNGGGPVDLTISNFHDSPGPTALTESFSMFRHPPREWSLLPIGAALAPSQARIVRSALGRLTKVEPDPSRVADFLTQLLRQVAQGEPTVGMDAMLTSIPEVPVDAGTLLTSTNLSVGSITRETASFDFRPLDPTNRTRYGPHVVCGDWAYADVFFKPTNESGSDLVMEATFLKTPQDQTGEPGHATGRNALCPCGSGLKYKRCHGAPPGARRPAT